MRQIRFFFLILYHKFFAQKVKPETVCFIKLDAIGDYILFRNFVAETLNSSLVGEEKILIIGNEIYKNLAETFDFSPRLEYIWVNVQKLLHNDQGQKMLFEELKKRSFKVMINPCYSRTLISDLVVFASQAERKVGWLGDDQNLRFSIQKFTNLFYDHLYKSDQRQLFEFYRNREFFNHLTGTPSQLTKPFFDSQRICKEQLVSFFIGSSSPTRKWPIENYASLGHYLRSTHKMTIQLLGGKDCQGEAETFREIFGSDFINLVGSTSLSELITVSAQSSINVSNDSSYPHICVATDSPVLVISNGNHYHRFVPYPLEVTNSYQAIFPFSEKTLTIEKQNELYERSDLQIHDISVEEVITQLELNFIGKK